MAPGILAPKEGSMDTYQVLSPYAMLSNWMRIMDAHPSVEDFKDFEEEFKKRFVEKGASDVLAITSEEGTSERIEQPSTTSTGWVDGDQDLFGDYICRTPADLGCHQHTVEDRFGSAHRSERFGGRAEGNAALQRLSRAV
jgi:hypothetical protein